MAGSGGTAAGEQRRDQELGQRGLGAHLHPGAQHRANAQLRRYQNLHARPRCGRRARHRGARRCVSPPRVQLAGPGRERGRTQGHAMKRSQGGATLLISLIMLIMLTLFAISAMNSGTINLKMVGNMQVRSEAMDASQSTIEGVLSSVQFINTPNDAIPLGLACGTANTTCTDVNNDGIPEYTTKLTPTPACVQARPLKISKLNLTPTSQGLRCVPAQQHGTF